MEIMELRPHHLLDIVSSHGAGSRFGSSPYGHAVHTCAQIVLNDPDTVISLVVKADFICAPCIHLVDGRCDDLINSLGPPVAKQDYNDTLDRRLMAYLQLEEGAQMTVREFLLLVEQHLEHLAELCYHPGEAAETRAHNLAAGLERIGLQ